MSQCHTAMGLLVLTKRIHLVILVSEQELYLSVCELRPMLFQLQTASPLYACAFCNNGVTYVWNVPYSVVGAAIPRLPLYVCALPITLLNLELLVSVVNIGATLSLLQSLLAYQATKYLPFIVTDTIIAIIYPLEKGHAIGAVQGFKLSPYRSSQTML
ncbi:hypothetical protein V8B55DRAFT_1410782 [Mucor lusitanicus]|uniref:Uncharacterized protein n=1 Tax=Mucor lusitanicus CBS 277.49 TaxID=747725 RepID=A0A162YJR1_MUCCL|nr:hypothetical protein MUCCIDRAFT_83937 [Mucor lusitanicus CBS 277.49]